MHNVSTNSFYLSGYKHDLLEKQTLFKKINNRQAYRTKQKPNIQRAPGIRRKLNAV